MTAALALAGHRFGRLIVLRRSAQNTPAGKSRWVCQCRCGQTIIATGSALLNKFHRSCGCLRTKLQIERNTKHGRAARGRVTTEYRSWCMMMQRCTNPNFPGFSKYGAIGVQVCRRWHKFENFFADMGRRPTGKTLDRINPFGDYTPSNCRWATLSEQARNTRKRWLTTTR